ncbi:tetratricopeptide repeat protein [Laspinema palackyanum]|uniref:O-linked N-acetylglucosamine transferase, SPINDLY family protein n=1 Tax=Laspinema palackyanum TaxID=3231601 RepID=UPI00345DF93E|nr:tetratricopeptide repeat protein [Laspinema sp. D2c]
MNQPHLIQKEDNPVEALIEQAEAYYRQGELQSALTICHQLIQIQPDFAPSYKLLGNLLQASGKLEAAIRAYQRAIALCPEFAEAHGNLGTLYYQQGDFTQAIAAYQTALEFNPNLAGLYWNLGKVFKETGELNQGIFYQKEALNMNPKLVGASGYFTLGTDLLNQGELEEARSLFQTTLELEPTSAEAHVHLGIIYRQQGWMEEAINSYKTAISLQPDLVEAHWNLYELFSSSDNFAAARKSADCYIEHCQGEGQSMAAIAWISAYLKAGSAQNAYQHFLTLESQVLKNLDNLCDRDIQRLYYNSFYILTNIRDNIRQNSHFYRQISQRFLPTIPRFKTPPPSRNLCPRLASTPLKIGIISPHYKRHSVGWCSADILRELSLLTPDLYLYVTGPLQPDDRTTIFENLAAKFYHPSEGVSRQTIFEEIQNDNLDILIDLDSLTIDTNIEILASRPAPICISWLGFEAPFISSKNYFLGDWQTHPQGTESYYQEQLIRMPDSFVASSGFERMKADSDTLRHSLGINSNQVVYLCVAPGRKFNGDLVRAQVAILNQVPESVLLYKGKGDRAVISATYQQECQLQNVSFSRLHFLPRTRTEEEHRTLYLLADVLLDSYPYNGGTHTLEALWFNLPLVTRSGEQFLSRMGYSFLQALGIQAGVAWSWEEYVEWGVRFGCDQRFHQQIKQQLIQSKTAETLAPLWNPKKFAQDMYRLFEQLRQLEDEKLGFY